MVVTKTLVVQLSKQAFLRVTCDQNRRAACSELQQTEAVFTRNTSIDAHKFPGLHVKYVQTAIHLPSHSSKS